MMPQPPPGQGPIDPRGAFPPPMPGSGPSYGPPPQAPPPGMYPPPPPPPYFYPPPPRGRGVWRTLFTIVLVLARIVSLMLNLFSAARGIFAAGSGNGGVQTTIVDGDAGQTIAVIPVTGVIETGAAHEFARFLSRAQEDANVKAVVIEVDSPGGTVTASDEIHHRIGEFRKSMAAQGRTVPVVVTMGSLAASGGYYIACAADHVVAQPTTMTGNIGVLFPRYNLSKLAQEWGVEEVTLESTGADYKNAGSMFKPENPDEVKYFQSIIDKSFDQFKAVVKNGRGPKLTKPLDQIANGQIYLGNDALALGLIDKVGYAKDAYAHAGQKLTKMQVVRYLNPPTVFDLLSAKSNVGAVSAGANGGVNVHLDWQKLQEFSTPRMMYLWRGE